MANFERHFHRERRLRSAALLHAGGQRHAAEERLFQLAQKEANAVTRAFGLELEGSELAGLWLEKNLEGFLEAAASARALKQAPLLSRLKRGLRSRGIDAWRAEYARRNPIPHYYWVRFGKVLRRSAALVERAGFVTLRGKRNLPPGRAELIVLELVTPRPELPRLRSQRLRSSRGVEPQYERWMEACILLAGGKLKRRTLAELLAEAHGVQTVLPGFREERFDPDAELVVEYPVLRSAPDEEEEGERVRDVRPRSRRTPG